LVLRERVGSLLGLAAYNNISQWHPNPFAGCKVPPTTRGQAIKMLDIHMVSESLVIDFMPIPIIISKTMRFKHSEDGDTIQKSHLTYDERKHAK
jgi:hypothetical protein